MLKLRPKGEEKHEDHDSDANTLNEQLRKTSKSSEL
jgi:hypothetical protein